jgi:hypothetical protein
MMDNPLSKKSGRALTLIAKGSLTRVQNDSFPLELEYDEGE